MQEVKLMVEQIGSHYKEVEDRVREHNCITWIHIVRIEFDTLEAQKEFVFRAKLFLWSQMTSIFTNSWE